MGKQVARLVGDGAEDCRIKNGGTNGTEVQGNNSGKVGTVGNTHSCCVLGVPGWTLPAVLPVSRMQVQHLDNYCVN